MKRLVIVYNSHSSKYSRVKKEILDQLTEGTWTPYEIDTKLDVDGNAKEMVKFIKPGDRIISAGGDGTAIICANAILQSGITDCELGVLPYGNFNDMARCFGGLNLVDITGPATKTEKVYPLEIKIDGKHRRYGVCYFTIGLLAESTEIFDHSKIRSRLRRSKKSISYSLYKLVGWYVRNSRHRFMPESFTVNGVEMHDKSDYAVVNGTSAAGVLRNRKRFYLDKAEFMSHSVNLRSFLTLVGFISRSVFWQIPGKTTRREVIEFQEPATVEIQGEGEYFRVEVQKTIEFVKPDKTINMIVGNYGHVRIRT